MNPESLVPEMKTRPVRDVINRLFDLGYPVLKVNTWMMGCLVEVSGYKWPIVSAEGQDLNSALEKAEKEVIRLQSIHHYPEGGGLSDASQRD